MSMLQQWCQRRLWVMAAVVGVSALAAVQYGASAQGTAKPKDIKSSDLVLIEKRLKELLETQQQILQRLDAMAQELQVIKVRCTR